MKKKQAIKSQSQGGLTNSQSISQSQNSQNKQGNTEDIKAILQELIQRSNLKKEEVLALFNSEKDKNDIPTSIFTNNKLSPLETLSKYLHENRSLKLSQIASLLNRNPRAVWAAYHSSKKKHPQAFIISQATFTIPTSEFSNNKFSILEVTSAYLKDNYALSIREISSLLTRDTSTIWTAYTRYKKKVTLHG